MINSPSPIASAALLALLLSALAMPWAIAEEPTPRPSTRPTVVYQSAALNELVAKAIDAVNTADWRHVEDAIKLFGDLQRADLLADAMALPSAHRSRILELVRTLPLETQRELLVRSLADDRVFKPEPKDGELPAARAIFLEQYCNFARGVVLRSGIDVDEFPFNPDDPAARLELHKRLAHQ